MFLHRICKRTWSILEVGWAAHFVGKMDTLSYWVPSKPTDSIKTYSWGLRLHIYIYIYYIYPVISLSFRHFAQLVPVLSSGFAALAAFCTFHGTVLGSFLQREAATKWGTWPGSKFDLTIPCFEKESEADRTPSADVLSESDFSPPNHLLNFAGVWVQKRIITLVNIKKYVEKNGLWGDSSFWSPHLHYLCCWPLR